MKTLPAGITWEQTRGAEWLVTVRRDPEVVYEWSDIRPMVEAQNSDYAAYVNAAYGNYGLYGSPLSTILGGIL